MTKPTLFESFNVFLLFFAFSEAFKFTEFKELLSLPFTSNRFPSSAGWMRAARPVSWINCGDESDLFRLDSLEMSPDPPKRSTPLTVHVQGLLKETLTEGLIEYEVKFGGFKLATGTLDGCSTLQKEQNLPQCPVKSDVYDVTHTVDLPWHIPPGRYLINAKGRRRADDKQIFCIDLDVAIDLINE